MTVTQSAVATGLRITVLLVVLAFGTGAWIQADLHRELRLNSESLSRNAVLIDRLSRLLALVADPQAAPTARYAALTELADAARVAPWVPKNFIRLPAARTGTAASNRAEIRAAAELADFARQVVIARSDGGAAQSALDLTRAGLDGPHAALLAAHGELGTQRAALIAMSETVGLGLLAAGFLILSATAIALLRARMQPVPEGAARAPASGSVADPSGLADLESLVPDDATLALLVVDAGTGASLLADRLRVPGAFPTTPLCVTRLGAGRIVAITDCSARPFDAQAVVEALQAQPVIAPGPQGARITCGLAYRRPGRPLALALANAGIAADTASARRVPLITYAPAIKRSLREDQRMERDIRRAFERDEFIAHFQPQISLVTGRVCGFEALARWNSPDKGLVPPGMFLPHVHRMGRSRDLTVVMLAQAVEALKDWGRQGHFIADVSLNLTRADLESPTLPDRIKWELDRAELMPEQLRVEVLETIHVTGEADPVIAALRTLSGMGVNIDMDDFGTGSTSITGLRRLGINRVKIDRSYVSDIDTDPSKRDLVRSIVSMAQCLKIQILAEGVETAQEQAVLKRLGCDLVQGYHMARPMPLDESFAWLDGYHSVPGDVGTDASETSAATHLDDAAPRTGRSQAAG